MRKQYAFMGNGYQFVRIITRLLGTDFIKEEYDDGVEFISVVTGKRLLKLVDSHERLVVRFDYPVPNLKKHTREIQGEQHLVWQHEGESVEDVIALLEIALENYRRKEIKSEGE